MAVLSVLDVSRAPSQQLINRGLIAAVHGYRIVLSRPLSWTGSRCRFQPTCSVYAEEALRNLGAIPGLAATVSRIARCGPWTPRGTVDPPPPARDSPQPDSP